ncbi:MAG: trigger factor [Betaproteobacteria bacterium HGW-Betaproteobacteria-11]|nr:MAG: trigger factor [Betaproteobacteria bacterium HGW-Betaproteobacteria-11]
MTDTQSIVQSSLERRIDIVVNLADVEKDVGGRLKRLARTVKMPGFRPGKVPMKIVEQQYGDQARSEAIGSAVERVFNEQVREQGLRVAGYPQVEPKADAAEGALGFSAVFEIYPEIASADVAGQGIEKPVLTVTDAEVAKTLEVLRKQRVSYVESDRPAQKEDRVIIDFVGRRDGEEFPGGKADDYTVVVGGGMMLPDFDAALEGLKATERKTFDVTFPADYQAAELAGKTVQFDVLVKKVETPRLPEIDADFARSLGVADGDVEKMHAEVRANLEREVKKRLRAKVKQQVMDLLVKAHPIEVPKALVEAESQQMAEATRHDMEARGMAGKNVPIDPSWFAEQATRRVTLGLILAELVKTQELHVKPEQVRATIDEFAETFEDPKEVVRWYYSQPQRLAEAEALTLENNVVEWVLARAAVTEKSVAFEDLMSGAA